MSATFELGNTALDVCKCIIRNNKEISSITLVAHSVGLNWRQINNTRDKKMENMLDGFTHVQPIHFKNYSRDRFLKLTPEKLPPLSKNQVWSFSSKVRCFNGESKHVPMMNFHAKGISLKHIKKAIKLICGNKKGVLLESGRFFHYYGTFLFEEKELIKFLAEFLMPCELVSPRYIGHRLFEGYCTLRLTADDKYKPKIPIVIDIL